MAGTLVKRVLLQLAADDVDAEAAIENIRLKAEELSKLHPELEPKIKSAAALAQMRVLREELKTAAAKPVEIPAELETTEAQVKAAGLLAQLEEVRAAAGDIKPKVNDRQAQLTILQLKAKLADLSEKIADPSIKISGVARAEAEIAAVRLQLDKLKAKEAELQAKADAEAAKGGILARFLGGSGGKVNSGLAGLLGNIPGMPDFVGSGEGGLPVTLGALGAVVDATAAASTEITGVVSGFAAAGAGAGAFALLALPAVKSVETEYQALNAANLKYQQAVTLEKMDPTTAHATAVKAALDQVNLIGQAYGKLPGQEQGAIDGIYKLTRTFSAMSHAFMPEAFKVFSGTLQLANELLPHLTPFATAFADAFSGLLGKAASFAGSSGFKDWLSQFEKLTGPSTTAIGSGIGNLVTSIGKLFTTMSAKDDVNAINIAFSVIDGVIIGFTGFVKGAMVTWDALTTAWDKSTDGIRTAGHGIASGFDTARHGAATAAHAIAGAFDVTRHGAATAGHATASAFDVMRSRIATALDGDLNFVRSHWKAVAGALADPVAAAVFEVRTHLHQIAQEFDSLRHDTASILAGMRHDIASAFDGARHDSAAEMASLRHGVASAWDSVRHDAAAWGDGMIRAVKHAWDSIFGSTKEGGAQVTGYVGSLPGRIMSLLARLPGDMFSIGQNIVEGLIRGIEAKGNELYATAKGMAGKVEHAFTDPLSIFSPSRVMMQHGEMVSVGVALGIEAGTPRIRQASAKMALAVSGTPLGAHGAAGGSGAAGTQRLQLEWVGGSADQALITLLKQHIRVRGGNPSVLGA